MPPALCSPHHGNRSHLCPRRQWRDRPNGTIPWHLPGSGAFQALTQGHPVIMGRKTAGFAAGALSPLPGRTNIVITRQPDWHQNGVQRVQSA